MSPLTCIDIDECATGLWFTKPSSNTNAPCLSESTCVNTNGSFQCCNTGFIRSVYNSSICVDIDECVDGSWFTLRSNNTGAPCASQEECLNTVGAFICCNPGFQRDVAGKQCVDINECITGGWVGNCTSKDACVNTNGSFFCCIAGLTNVLDLV